MSWFRSYRRDKLGRKLGWTVRSDWDFGLFWWNLGILWCSVLSVSFLLLGFYSYPELLILAGMSNFLNICLKFLQYKLYHVHLLVIKASV